MNRILRLAEPTKGGAASATLVVLPVEQLREMLREVLRVERDEHAAGQIAGPLLIGVGELAGRLGVSRATANEWRLEGCPAVLVGTTNYRFELAAVLTWLRTRGSK